jgi:hypothetical protein
MRVRLSDHAGTLTELERIHRSPLVEREQKDATK